VRVLYVHVRAHTGPDGRRKGRHGAGADSFRLEGQQRAEGRNRVALRRRPGTPHPHLRRMCVWAARILDGRRHRICDTRRRAGTCQTHAWPCTTGKPPSMANRQPCLRARGPHPDVGSHACAAQVHGKGSGGGWRAPCAGSPAGTGRAALQDAVRCLRPHRCIQRKSTCAWPQLKLCHARALLLLQACACSMGVIFYFL